MGLDPEVVYRETGAFVRITGAILRWTVAVPLVAIATGVWTAGDGVSFLEATGVDPKIAFGSSLTLAGLYALLFTAWVAGNALHVAADEADQRL